MFVDICFSLEMFNLWRPYPPERARGVAKFSIEYLTLKINRFRFPWNTSSIAMRVVISLVEYRWR